MIKDLYEVLKALVNEEEQDYIALTDTDDGYCVYCKTKSDIHYTEDISFYTEKHKPDCPIMKGRELVKQFEALPDDPGVIAISPEVRAEIKEAWAKMTPAERKAALKTRYTPTGNETIDELYLKWLSIPDKPDPDITPQTVHGNYPPKRPHGTKVIITGR